MFRFASTLVVFVAMTAAPAFVRGAPAPARAAAPKADARVLPALLQQAEDAVRAKNFKAARDAFLDALSLDKKNQRALEGAGTAYLQLQDFPHAKPLLEQAADAAGTAGLSRSLVLNLSAVHVRQKNPMRAAKLVRDYLAARADKVDEQALNAMGVALWQADDSARRGPLFRECAKFYETANAKLESTRPGQKRWGVEWVDQGEWSAREGRWKAQQAVADQKHSELVGRRNELARAQKDLNNATRPLGVRRASPAQVDSLRRRAADALADAAAAEKEYASAAAAVERPKFPELMEPIPLEAAPLALAKGPTVRIDVKKQPPGGARPAEAPVVQESKDPAPPQSPRRVRVVLYAAAFAVAPDLLVTAASALDNVDEITVQSGEGAGWAAKVVRKDVKIGLALLRLQGEDAKLKPLALADTFSAGAVSCVSFPSVNIFDPAPERLDGGAGAPKDEGWTVRLSRHPRLPGGPLIAGGKVVGVELASRDSELGQIPAVTLDELREFVRDHLPEPRPARAVTDPTAATMQLTAVSETIE